MYDELDLLEQAELEANETADRMEFSSEVDRRKLVFFSLATAPATTFGFGAKSLAQAGAAGGGVHTRSSR